MRIAIFSDHFHPELGGIQDSVESLATALGRRGHAVDFYAPRYAQAEYRRVGLEPGELRLGERVSISRFASLPFPSATDQSRLVLPLPWRWLRLLRRRRPDVIHTQTFFGVGLEALLVARILGIPIVGTNHMAIKAFAAYLPFKSRWAVDYVLWYYNHCDFVTAPSQSVFDDLGLFMRPVCHSVISNPIDTMTYAPVTLDYRRALKVELGLNDTTLCYAGRLGVEKSIDVVFRAIALVRERLPSIELVLAGHGAHERALHNLAFELDITQNVRFLGTLEKAKLAMVLQASDIFVTMSTSETQGMAMLQAMACGLPAIGARSRALPEFIDVDTGITVEPEDHVGLAESIIQLLTDDERRRRLGRQAAASVGRFGVDAVAGQWEALYLQLLRTAGSA
jgi:glycosyltransferase involved in cell wall biosynthesis